MCSGVDINDLEMKRLEEFDDLMEEIGHLARLRLHTTSEPYLVQLLHPTVDDTDIGAPWLPRKLQIPQAEMEIEDASVNFFFFSPFSLHCGFPSCVSPLLRWAAEEKMGGGGGF